MLIIVIAAAALAAASGGAALWRLWSAVPNRNADLVLF
jgi:hypothetical protein